MSDTADLERLRELGLQAVSTLLRRDGFDSLTDEKHGALGQLPVLVRSLPRGEARVALSNSVDEERRGGGAWVVTPLVGWRDAQVEDVLREALASAGQPPIEHRWASITAPASGIRPDGNLRTADYLEVRDDRQLEGWAARVYAGLTADLPGWLGQFAGIAGVLEYAKRWPVLGDYAHQLTGLIVACLNGFVEEVEYFGTFVFRRTARAMLRHAEYAEVAARYAAIGAVTGVDVPVPTLAEVERWAAEQQARKKY